MFSDFVSWSRNAELRSEVEDLVDQLTRANEERARLRQVGERLEAEAQAVAERHKALEPEAAAAPEGE